MIVAAVTLKEILQLLLLFIIANVVLTAPFILAGFLAWLEYRENQSFPRSRG